MQHFDCCSEALRKLPKRPMTWSGRMPTLTAVGHEELWWLEGSLPCPLQHLPSRCPEELKPCEGATAVPEAARLHHPQLPAWSQLPSGPQLPSRPQLPSQPQLQSGGGRVGDHVAAAGCPPLWLSPPRSPPRHPQSASDAAFSCHASVGWRGPPEPAWTGAQSGRDR